MLPQLRAPDITVPAFVLGLQKRSLAEGLDFPLADELVDKLQRKVRPPHAVHRMARQLSLHWARGDELLPHLRWTAEAVLDAVALAQQVRPEEDLLTSVLAGPCCRAYVLLGRHDELVHLAQAVAQALLDQPQREAPGPLLQPLLHSLRHAGSLAGLQALMPALLPRLAPDLPWAGPMISALSQVARTAEDLPTLTTLSGWLDALWPAGVAAPAWLERPPPQAWSGLSIVAVRCLRLDVMCRLLERLMVGDTARPAGDAMAKLLHVLSTHLGGPDVLAWAERAAQKLPSHPGIRMAQLQALADSGAPPELLDGVLEQLDAEHPGYELCLRMLGELAFEAGKVPLALQVLRLQEAAGTLDDMGALRLRHLTVRDADRETLEATPQDLPILSAFKDFHEGLLPLGELLMRPPLHASPDTPDDIRRACEAAEAHFAAHLAQQPLPPLKEVLSTVTAMWLLANAGALELRYWKGTFPFDFGPAFGTLDPLRAAAQCDGVLNHLVRLARHVLALPQPLAGGQEQASVGDLVQIAKWAVDAHLALDQPEQALADLAALRQRLGPLGAQALDVLEECCSLETGQLDIARAARARLPQTVASEVVPMNPWEDWAAFEGGTLHLVASDDEVPGQWDVVQPDGQLRQAQHHALATELSVLPCRNLLVRNSHLLIGSRGGIMQAHAWHRQMGSFPFPHPSVLNRGLKGATLAVPAEVQQVDEPLVVLTNMDATFHRNFYHWMVLTLARIQLLNEEGLLAGRRLLLPEEMSGWMKSSLRDIGLQPEQIRFYGVHEVLRLADAWVASPSEYASPTQVERLRRCLWRAAGLDPAAPPAPSRCLYITRSGEFRRPFLEEREVAAAAVELGFECVAPETLPLLEQVKLFAQAKGIAGPPGAAFTNLMWAQAGTRVLTFFKQEINGPTFLDLSFLRGQQHRWLQGRSLPGFEYISVVTSPYSVDVALARRELQWVAGA